MQSHVKIQISDKSPKSVHNILVPENVSLFLVPENVLFTYFFFLFCDIEIPLRCLKVEFEGQKSQNFNLKSGIKS